MKIIQKVLGRLRSNDQDAKAHDMSDLVDKLKRSPRELFKPREVEILGIRSMKDLARDRWRTRKGGKLIGMPWLDVNKTQKKYRRVDLIQFLEDRLVKYE